MADAEVEVKLKATGADAAVAEIKKVEGATTDVEKATEDLGQKTESIGSKAGRLKEVAAATGAIGIAAAAAAKTFGQVKDALESVNTEQLRAVDSAMADNIESAKDWATALEDPIGMLLKLTTGSTVKSAFDDLNDQLQRNATMTAEAVDRFIEKSGIQIEEIKRQAADLKAANALLDAQAETAATKRAGRNAERIRNGEAPEDVAADEAKAVAADKIAKIEREQEQARVGLQEKFDAAKRARLAAEEGEAAGGRIDGAQSKFDAAENAFKTDNFTSLTELESRRDAARKELEQTRQRDGVAAAATKETAKAAEDAKKAFEDQKKIVAQEDALAEERKNNIREEATNKVTDSGANKSKRIEKEEAAAKAKADAADQRAAAAAGKQAQDTQRQAQRDALDAKKAGLDSTAQADGRKFSNAGKNVGGKLGDALQGIGSKLADGTDQKEIAKIQEEFIKATQGLGGSTVAAMKAMLDAQLQQAKEIEQLKQRIRNN